MKRFPLKGESVKGGSTVYTVHRCCCYLISCVDCVKRLCASEVPEREAVWGVNHGGQELPIELVVN